MREYNKIFNREYEPFSYEVGLVDTGKTKIIIVPVNCDGDKVIIECTHKILVANKNEVTSTGSSAKVISVNGKQI